MDEKDLITISTAAKGIYKVKIEDTRRSSE
jgi:hypothetical protein